MRRNISLPEDLDLKMQDYCDRNGFSVSSFVKHLIKMKIDFEYSTDNVSDIPKGRGSSAGTPISATARVVKEKGTLLTLKNVQKIASNVTQTKVTSAIKKRDTGNGMCQHGISVVGYCRECLM